ncbi:MAG: hypothetical protein G01um101430_7 [Parcubacteria group bacterium Gr01-1014_30]|nr:MAG: hypothetical protein G01um101430_7 [Parcubacteria group bacterium Gr01-1014_30]
MIINLLPPQQKRELRQEELFRAVLILGIVLLFFLASLILILFSIKIYIQSVTHSLETLVQAEQKLLHTAELQELRQVTDSNNREILDLKSFYEKQIYSLPVLNKLFEALPEGISLTSLSWQRESGQVVISGFSPSRDVLLSLRNRLEAQEEFSEVYFPPQNWIKPENIDFQTTFKIAL